MTTIRSNKEQIHTKTITETPEFIPLIVEKIWSEWSDDFIQYTSLTNIDSLSSYIQSIKEGKKEKEGKVPMVYVIYYEKEKEKRLIGFCWIDNEDTNIMNWVKPWLSNIFIMEEFRNNGFATILLNHVTRLYSPLHLWCKTKELANFYLQFGFEVLDTILHYNDEEYIYIMKKV